ncbi:PIN domain-containing protein [Streptomyces sp. MK37H]|uniref:PIN domain-containing protein n=1 Tax=Streptomyces sp. MK37H TaxID=2699117 RepID=UPI001FFAB58C|nr:PIN domain-containing protein [Streptomyces sp. MK37H]
MNLQRPYGSAFEGLLTYLEWATESARMLRSQISGRDLDQLVFTDRYRDLLGSCGTLAGTAQQRLVNGLVQLEVAERIEAFEAAVAALDTRIGRWSQREVFVVADSSFYIQNEVKLAVVGLPEVLDVPRRQFVRLLFPIVVVDELDDLKDASKQRARWRAAHTLGLLDGVLNGGTHGVLHEGEHTVRDGETRGQAQRGDRPRSPGHVRLDRPDVEIIDRTVAIQGPARRDVRLLTCDASQHTAAAAVGSGESVEVVMVPAAYAAGHLVGADLATWGQSEGRHNRLMMVGRTIRSALRRAGVQIPVGRLGSAIDPKRPTIYELADDPTICKGRRRGLRSTGHAPRSLASPRRRPSCPPPGRWSPPRPAVSTPPSATSAVPSGTWQLPTHWSRTASAMCRMERGCSAREVSVVSTCRCASFRAEGRAVCPWRLLSRPQAKRGHS